MRRLKCITDKYGNFTKEKLYKVYEGFPNDYVIDDEGDVFSVFCSAFSANGGKSRDRTLEIFEVIDK